MCEAFYCDDHQGDHPSYGGSGYSNEEVRNSINEARYVLDNLDSSYNEINWRVEDFRHQLDSLRLHLDDLTYTIEA